VPAAPSAADLDKAKKGAHQGRRRNGN
jgi:hypothetical protein